MRRASPDTTTAGREMERWVRGGGGGSVAGQMGGADGGGVMEG